MLRVGLSPCKAQAAAVGVSSAERLSKPLVLFGKESQEINYRAIQAVYLRKYFNRLDYFVTLLQNDANQLDNQCSPDKN